MTEKKKDKKERSKHKRDRELADIRCVAKTPEGRRFVWRILSNAGIFRINGIQESIGMARFEGRREGGIEILNDVMAAKPALFGQMQEEHASEKKREDIIDDKEKTERDPLSLTDE